MGLVVGAAVGTALDGIAVGAALGETIGTTLGPRLGTGVGALLGAADGGADAATEMIKPWKPRCPAIRDTSGIQHIASFLLLPSSPFAVSFSSCSGCRGDAFLYFNARRRSIKITYCSVYVLQTSDFSDFPVYLSKWSPVPE